MTKAAEKAAAKAAAEQEQAAVEAANAQNENAAPEQPGADGAGDGQGADNTPPAPEQDGEPELFTLSELAEKFRLPSWQSAALHKLMEWEPGKQVTETEYLNGMAALKNRRVGG
jgi:hypothetical protein